MKVYIRPLPAYFDVEDLRRLVGMYGLVGSATMINERPGEEAERCAIVEMMRPAEAKKVCHLLDGKEFRGKTLRVSMRQQPLKTKVQADPIT